MLTQTKALDRLNPNKGDPHQEDLLTFKNFEIRDTLKGIIKDEEKHMRILEGLIRVLGPS